MFKKFNGSSLRQIQEFKRFNSLRHIQGKSSFLWVVFKKKGSISCSKKKCSILWVVLKVFNSVSRIKSVQFCGSHSQKKFNSVGRIHKSSILWVYEKTLSPEKKGPFLWIKSFQKSSSIWVTSKRKFNYLSHVKKVQVLESWKKEQFFQSNWAKKSSLSHIFNKKSSILWVISKKGSILSILSEFFVKKINSKSNF